MKAVPIEEFGGPDVLTIKEWQIPSPTADEVLVRLSFAGINFIDTQIRSGSYQTSSTYPTVLPLIHGEEGAGVISEVGDNVDNFKKGDRVAFCWHGGSYAEYAAIPVYRVVKVPEDIPLEMATALMMQGLTAQYLTYSTAPLKLGQTCLIHAAAGGVGQILVQLAKNRGATVIASVGSSQKAKIARDCGSDYTILYRETDFREEVMKITHGKGVDVVFDSVGKDTIDRSITSLCKRGLCVLLGGASGLVREINPQKFADAGSIFFTRPHLQHYLCDAEEMTERATILFDLLRAKKLNVAIFKEFPLAEAAQAHKLMERGETLGKMLLRIE